MSRHFNVSRELVEYRLKVCRLWAEYRERHPEEDAARELAPPRLRRRQRRTQRRGRLK